MPKADWTPAERTLLTKAQDYGISLLPLKDAVNETWLYRHAAPLFNRE